MELGVVGHACLWVRAGGKTLVVDPWLDGPVCYGSWWHYPKPVFDEELLNADYVYLTHWHPDHFHRPSLARFSKKTQVLVPKFPIASMPRSLGSVGFEKITELDHGRPFALAPGFDITSFQVQYEDDSVLCIRADGTNIINLNDAKPMPSLWRTIRREHADPDFMFRSFSPAWSYPACYSFEDPGEAPNAGRDEYLKLFWETACMLRPKYAVPFASGICHLHKETLNKNSTLLQPPDLLRYFEQHPAGDVRLMPMPAGSRWSAESGFQIDERSLKADFQTEVASLRLTKEKELEAIYAREDELPVVYGDFEGFFRDLLRKAFWLRPFFKPVWAFDLSVKGAREFWVVDFGKGSVRRQATEPQDLTSRIEVHAGILCDALRRRNLMNLDIAKRWNIRVRRGMLSRHLFFFVLVSLFESGHLSLRNLLSLRSLSVWNARRSEIKDYAKLLFKLKQHGIKALTEETISGIEIDFSDKLRYHRTK